MEHAFALPTVADLASFGYHVKALLTFLTCLRLSVLHAEDLHWTSNDAIFDMQRRFVAGDTEALKSFDAKSDQIAVSPDGRHVFVVRDHYAYDYKDRFMEMNAPPKEGKGYSTKVINCFTWVDDGKAISHWGKITLPRDAKVEHIRFRGDKCELRIRQASSDQFFDFIGAATSIYGLSAVTISADGHNDHELWKKLKEKSGRSL